MSSNLTVDYDYDANWSTVQITLFLVDVLVCLFSVIGFFGFNFIFLNCFNLREKILEGKPKEKKRVELEEKKPNEKPSELDQLDEIEEKEKMEEKEENKEAKKEEIPNSKQPTKKKKVSILGILQFLFSEVFNIGFPNPQADNHRDNLFMLTLLPFIKIRKFLFSKKKLQKSKIKYIRKLEFYGTLILFFLKIVESFYLMSSQVISYIYYQPEQGFFGYYRYFTTTSFTILCFYEYFSVVVLFIFILYQLGRFFNETYDSPTHRLFKYLNFICWNWFVYAGQLAICVTGLYNIALLPTTVAKYGFLKILNYDNISVHYVQSVLVILEFVLLVFMKINLIQILMLPFIGCVYYAYISLLCKFSLTTMPYGPLLVVENEEGIQWFVIAIRVIFVLVFIFLFLIYFVISFLRGVTIQGILKKHKKKKLEKKNSNNGIYSSPVPKKI